MVEQFDFGTENLKPRKILVYIPEDRYKGFLEKCEPWRGEYEVLRDSVVARNSKGESSVVMVCAVLHAKMLLDLACQVYPEAAPYIRDSIRVERKPR